MVSIAAVPELRDALAALALDPRLPPNTQFTASSQRALGDEISMQCDAHYVSLSSYSFVASLEVYDLGYQTLMCLLVKLQSSSLY